MEQLSSSLLHPDSAAPRRIAALVVEALADCRAVSRIAVFGSIAEGRDDRYSDIDLFCAVEGDDGAWQAAQAVRRVLPLRWHGRFGDVAAPAGRHWLVGQSLFHSIDLSYDTIDGFDHKVAHGVRSVPVVVDVRLDRRGVVMPGRPALHVVSDDYPFTSALYATTKAIRDCLRGNASPNTVAERMAVLEDARLRLSSWPAASDPDGLLLEMRQIWRALR